MTTVTGPLRDPNQAPTIAAHNAETVRNLSEGLIEAQKERIAELQAEVEALKEFNDELQKQIIPAKETMTLLRELNHLQAENAALRAVAAAVDGVGQINTHMGNWQPLWDAMAAARAAGYLPAKEMPK